MNQNVINERQKWLESAVVPETDKAVILSMSEEETIASFSDNMVFGTAGLRSVMGPGPSKMNLFTVAQATAGLAQYILENSSKENAAVAIAYDSRNQSEAFAKRSAEVLSAYGIKTFIYPSLRPTPMLSYAVRALGCIAGINVTASHNAKEYNGYKVYWADGAQIGTEQADAISALIAKTDIFTGVPSAEKAEASLICLIPSSLDEAYKREVLAQRVDATLIPRVADELDIVYTPLHGTGAVVMPSVLKEAGLKKIHFVEEQMVADGNFPTAAYPNPENADVFSLGIKEADKFGSDLIIATDPDADRVGTMVRNHEGQFVRLSGNQMGALLLDYIISSYLETGSMPEHPYVVKSFVSTEMATAICERYGITIHNVLTGFKYIGETIKNYEAKGYGSFLLGFEESYGYLKGTYARDKDSIVATLLICEMAAYYRLKKMTLFDAMQALYAKYGFFKEDVFSVTYSGVDSAEKMVNVMAKIRQEPPKTIGSFKVISVTDYSIQSVCDLTTGKISETGLPKANALRFITDNGVTAIIRPSGTEPKIKIYCLSGDPSQAELERKLSICKEALQSLFKS